MRVPTENARVEPKEMIVGMPLTSIFSSLKR